VCNSPHGNNSRDEQQQHHHQQQQQWMRILRQEMGVLKGEAPCSTTCQFEAEICVLRGTMAERGTTTATTTTAANTTPIQTKPIPTTNSGGNDTNGSNSTTSIREWHHFFVNVMHIRQNAIAQRIQLLEGKQQQHQ
jgi:hypothetical protein